MVARKRAIPKRKSSRRPARKTKSEPRRDPRPDRTLTQIPRFEQAAKMFFSKVLEAAEEDPEGFTKKAKAIVDKADAAYRYLEENPEKKRELRNKALSTVAGLLRKRLSDG